MNKYSGYNIFTHVHPLPIKGTTDSGLLSHLLLAVKDNIDVAGMPTTAASPALQGHRPKHHASAISLLLNAGASVIAKANMHELSLGITSNNKAYGSVRNPYNPECIPGGSSGGTAAAVAARAVPAGIGSDTGGSLRIPAALCGVVGFRPTTGRWPSDGAVSISKTRDTLGPIALTVSDCALLDAVVCEVSEFLANVSLTGLRIGVPRRGFWENLEPETALAAQSVLAKLTAAGVQLVECDVGINMDECTHAGMLVALGEMVESLRTYHAAHKLAFDPAAFGRQIASPDVSGIFNSLLGKDAPSKEDYNDALTVQRPKYSQAYARCFSTHNIDALIFPTTPRPAALIGEDDTVMLNGQAVPTFLTFTRNVGPGSLVGLPGISVPMGQTKSGLPLGIALDGPAGTDRRLLAIALAIETLLPQLPPPQLLLPPVAIPKAQ
jgi:indoleacetamide hydrolase